MNAPAREEPFIQRSCYPIWHALHIKWPGMLDLWSPGCLVVGEIAQTHVLLCSNIKTSVQHLKPKRTYMWLGVRLSLNGIFDQGLSYTLELFDYSQYVIGFTCSSVQVRSNLSSCPNNNAFCLSCPSFHTEPPASLSGKLGPWAVLGSEGFI